jgi:hypothetical protein
MNVTIRAARAMLVWRGDLRDMERRRVGREVRVRARDVVAGDAGACVVGCAGSGGSSPWGMGVRRPLVLFSSSCLGVKVLSTASSFLVRSP